jgi:hypothetical protein
MLYENLHFSSADVQFKRIMYINILISINFQ